MSGSVRRGGFVGLIALLIVGVAWTAPEAARAHGSLVVTVEEPFSIQGQMYPSGRLVLRQVGDARPGVTRHEVAVNGSRLALLEARRSPVSGGAPETAALFGRDAKGRLLLIGYLSHERQIYRF
jgi:hypothetical protein